MEPSRQAFRFENVTLIDEYDDTYTVEATGVGNVNCRGALIMVIAMEQNGSEVGAFSAVAITESRNGIAQPVESGVPFQIQARTRPPARIPDRLTVREYTCQPW
ncbi:MAG: hypothetical protein NZ482_06390 [Gloeomargarita sp. SKYG98]|nr:hypothetical protein [Gloeomargarita sp. SKYG98]